MTNQHTSIYKKLESFFGSIDQLINIDYQRYQAKGYMDLVVEKTNNSTTPEFSFAHYYVQNGDLCCDPEMTLRIDKHNKTAESLTFQMSIPPIYTEVHSANGSVNLKTQKMQNEFLLTWLDNIIASNYRPKKTDNPTI